MVSNERAGPVSPLAPTATEAVASATAGHAGPRDGHTAPIQTASFAIGELLLELSAAPGVATMAIVVGPDRDSYALDPTALGSWSEGSRRLLALSPAAGPGECAEFRAPFLHDVDGRTFVAFEADVAEGSVAYRLLVVGAAARIGVFATTRETVAGVIEAADGAVLVARTTGFDGQPSSSLHE